MANEGAGCYSPSLLTPETDEKRENLMGLDVMVEKTLFKNRVFSHYVGLKMWLLLRG
jgi:hypothetical protein